MKRYSHPEHGYHIPANPEELKAMLANGWKEDDGMALAAKLRALEEPAEEKPRRGRPPNVDKE